MDFSNYVRALLQQGRVVEARQLWDSVVEVIPELPGLLRVLGVDFFFPSWEFGPSRLFWPEWGGPG